MLRRLLLVITMVALTTLSGVSSCDEATGITPCRVEGQTCGFGECCGDLACPATESGIRYCQAREP